MEHCWSNYFHSPEKVVDYRASGYRDVPESTDTSEVAYQSVGYDSGIGLSSFQSTEANSLQGEVTGPECVLEDLRKLDLNEQEADSLPIQVSLEVCQSQFQPANKIDWPSEEELFKQNQDGDTFLHLAIIKPDICNVFHLIEMAHDPDHLNIQNMIFMHAPLHLAVIMNQPQVVRALVVSGACVMTRDRHGDTPLHLACKLGNLECVKQLTAPPSNKEQEYVSSTCAARNLAPRAIKPMISSDIGLMNYDGETCLHLALSSGTASTFEILDHLISICGANINVEEGKCGYTILHEAVKTKDVDVVAFLLRYPQISVNQPCYSGNTALDIAVSLNFPRLEMILRMSGAVCTKSDDNEVDEFDDLTIGGMQISQ